MKKPISGTIKTTLLQRTKDIIKDIDKISQDIPGIIIIHNLRTRAVEYMSERGLKYLNTTLEDLKALGAGYFDLYFNREDADNYIPRFLEMLEKNDPEYSFSYFQQVRPNTDAEWGWFLSCSKVLLVDDDNRPFLSITTAHPANDLKSVTYKIERLLEEKEIMQQRIENYAQLTIREKEIIKLMVSGFSSAVIANKLFIAQATVEKHRQNIRNKLCIKTLPELVRFAQVFNIM